MERTGLHIFCKAKIKNMTIQLKTHNKLLCYISLTHNCLGLVAQVFVWFYDTLYGFWTNFH